MYDLPSRGDVTKCVVTKEVIESKEEPILVTADKGKKDKKEETA